MYILLYVQHIHTLDIRMDFATWTERCSISIYIDIYNIYIYLSFYTIERRFSVYVFWFKYLWLFLAIYTFASVDKPTFSWNLLGFPQTVSSCSCFLRNISLKIVCAKQCFYKKFLGNILYQKTFEVIFWLIRKWFLKNWEK